MAIYLIDYENIKDLTGIEKLSEKDTVVIFYSKNANSLTFEAHREIMQAKAKIEYKSVEVGKQNALDFQLSSYLGYVIKATDKQQTQYFVVSKDSGFGFVVNFWKNEKNVDVELCTNLKGKTQDKEAKEKCAAIQNALKQSKLNLTEEDIAETTKIVSQFKTKVAINNNLQKHFRDSEKVRTVMKTLKPHIKDKT